ncbi:MAG: HD domain-containing protein, partial [Lachnospiraceae bacterium]|nr:HD domain-containing protein [Lachnospiraceae bacterium]
LLEHTLGVVRICNFLGDTYSLLDKDLLMTAGLFHDIGKMTELAEFPASEYTDDGQLLGHIFIGAELIGNTVKEIPDFPPRLASELRHCILAHHGELEYGSPKKPALVEAFALNLADNIDAKMQTFSEAFDMAGDNMEWLGFNRILDSNIRQTYGTRKQ